VDDTLAVLVMLPQPAHLATQLAALARISDAHTVQFWDAKRLVSHMLGEHDRQSIVWDHVAVYPTGATWDQGPPEPFYENGPVVRVAKPLRDAIARALAGRR
jgi:hypothetical protein